MIIGFCDPCAIFVVCAGAKSREECCPQCLQPLHKARKVPHATPQHHAISQGEARKRINQQKVDWAELKARGAL